MATLLRSFLAAFIACLAAIACAQDYPAKPVRIVVPFPPVGAADLLTRALGKRLSESWSQPVIADNRPGAGGNIGAEAVATSAPDGYTLLLAGNVILLFDSIPSALPQIRAGKLRAIAVASSHRSPVLPELPTVAEGGLAGFSADNWFGVMAPAGTPRGIVAKLNADIVKALESAELKDLVARQGG